ncbi:MAG: Succinate dehydrogenase cytochrome b subunit, partial [uncultured Friedmanniella sp.]
GNHNPVADATRRPHDGGAQGADGRQRAGPDRLPAGTHVRQPQALLGPAGLRRLRAPPADPGRADLPAHRAAVDHPRGPARGGVRARLRGVQAVGPRSQGPRGRHQALPVQQGPDRGPADLRLLHAAVGRDRHRPVRDLPPAALHLEHHPPGRRQRQPLPAGGQRLRRLVGGAGVHAVDGRRGLPPPARHVERPDDPRGQHRRRGPSPAEPAVLPGRRRDHHRLPPAPVQHPPRTGEL